MTRSASTLFAILTVFAADVVTGCTKHAPTATDRSSPTQVDAAPSASPSASPTSEAVVSAMPSQDSDASAERRVLYPEITVDRTIAAHVAPFTVRWEGFPAVSVDGKTFAAIVDTGTTFPHASFVLVDAETGARKETIDLLGGAAARKWQNEDDRSDAVASAYTAETSTRARTAMSRVATFAPLPRQKLDVSTLYETASRRGGKLAQEAAIGGFVASLNGDQLILRRGETTLLVRGTTPWKKSPVVIPNEPPCVTRPALSEVAVDEPRRRALVIVHHLVIDAGDRCAEPEDLHVVSWSSDAKR